MNTPPLRTLIQLLIAIATFGCALELIARADDWLSWGASFGGNYSNRNLTMIDERGMRCAPNAQFEKWSLNQHGFRGSPISQHHSGDEKRVFVVGASESFGLYERDGFEFPAQLERQLNQQSNHSYDVQNASCPGMSPPRVTQFIELYLNDFQPDLLIVYPTPHFYLDLDAPAVIAPRPGRRGQPFRPRLLRKVKTVLKRLMPAAVQTRIRQFQIDRAVASQPEQWLWREPPTERLELFAQHLDELLAAAQKAAPRVILMTHANRFGDNSAEVAWDQAIAWRKFYPRADYSTLLEMDRQANQLLRQLAAERSIELVDTYREIPSTAENFADFSHFTEAGSTLVATSLAKSILTEDRNP